jgi:hypothetical protein
MNIASKKKVMYGEERRYRKGLGVIDNYFSF